jgi:L-aspartate oxidase
VPDPSARASADGTETDFLIVGSGIAGLRAAIALAPAGRVVILTKADPSESNTGYAQGGIAAAVGDDDRPALHAADTVRAGDGLCDEQAVRVLVEEGPRYVNELIEWGTTFDRDRDGRLALGREAAHSVRRVLHAGDATGREIARVLWHLVSGLGAITTISPARVTDLIVEEGHVRGAVFWDARSRRVIRAGTVLLATGGAGCVYRETTNPPIATGDGVALAYRAGARLADLEFVQFHPTALNIAGAPRFLISEALRGEGARLVNARGEPFMPRYHPDGDLAPRDVVARAIAREVQLTGGPVFLTLAHLDARQVRERFPTIAAMCRRVGLDLARDRIPVGPAAHYIMGGVDTDVWGRTSLPGLFAAGEVACTGVHGANRLASNSLLEGLVFGARAGAAMQQAPAAAPLRPDRALRAMPDISASASPARPAQEASPSVDSSIDASPAAVGDLMWDAAGLFRSGEGLNRAVSILDGWYRREAHRTIGTAETDLDSWRRLNLITVARLIARAALRRRESRGAHYRSDFPGRDDRAWCVHLVDVRDDSSGAPSREEAVNKGA